MNLLILHNPAGPESSADEADVLDQVRAVGSALRSMGHTVREIPCSLDLERLQDALVAAPPDLVFNLVESLGCTDRLAALVPYVLDAMGIPFTGSPGTALYEACSKLLTKQKLAAAGLPVADWISLHVGEGTAGPVRWKPTDQVILKSVWEHASFGLDDASVVEYESLETIRARLAAQENRTNKPWFAERFIDGREFNLSVLESTVCPGEPEVLPPAEIEFVNYPSWRPRIVGHRAKWVGDSMEYRQTQRRFDFGDGDGPLLATLAGLAKTCWKAFGLRGYARIDFRVDLWGKPWILEVNANPCLTPDAGLAAAAERAGLSYLDLVARIVMAAARERAAGIPALAG